ncbi:MAG: hypothetical protein D6731_18140 [Planctomycetota bacterium]|nr:MAG: hypothetical protein D6731_18140 [Planctomycetota bacterium]
MGRPPAQFRRLGATLPLSLGRAHGRRLAGGGGPPLFRLHGPRRHHHRGRVPYLHNATGDHCSRKGELSRLVVRAARRVGLRVALLRTIYDVREKPGQARMAQPIDEAIAEVRALAAEYAHDPAVTVLPAPHSLHGASREAIEAAATLARELEVPWHIHLAEQEGDVPFARQRYGTTPLLALERFGVLDERTVLVHGIWLSEEERTLLGERRGAVVSNPTTNMALGDGIADLPDLLRKGVTVGLGTDMNAKPNIFDELRAAEALQRVRRLRMGILAERENQAPDPARPFALATQGGARSLGLEVGSLEPGRWADFLAVDLRDPSLLPASLRGGDSLLGVLSSGMVPETALRGSWVGGRRILWEGDLHGLPWEELAARVRGCRAWRDEEA